MTERDFGATVERYSHSPRAIALAAAAIGVVAVLWQYERHFWNWGVASVLDRCRALLFGSSCDELIGTNFQFIGKVFPYQKAPSAPRASDLLFGLLVAVAAYVAIVLLVLSVRAIKGYKA